MVQKCKFSVRNMKYEADLLNELREYYESVPLAELKTNIDFILHICNAVENKIKKDKKKYKYDKKQIVISLISKLCGDLSDNDKKTVQTTIESLHSSKAIYKLSFLKKLKDILFNFLKKIVLK